MRPTDGSVLSDDEFQQLQNLADRFAEARSRGGVNDWEPYLPPSGDRLRRHVLIELAKLDLEFTWREGGRVLVETYETLFPELTPPPIDLIAEEYRIRHRHGDAPKLEEYRERFPDRAAEIESFLRSRPQDSGPGVGSSARATVRGEAQLPPSIREVFPQGYTPIERIGKGNFGEVWRAEAPGGIAVAVKIISEPLDHDSAKKELAALELIKRLQHPKLLSTLAFWVIQNRLVIAMELADGTLRDRLKQWQAQGQNGIPADELIPYFRDAAEGLDWLHWQGVLHRDIKPENILLKHGYAKVGDFGLAKMGRMDVLVSASFAGTPAFMAPEVWGQKACPQSDQYSLAFTYAELRLGRRPLGGNDFLSVMKSALEGIPDLEGMPESEQAILRRALAKRPEERFATCVEFVEALENVVLPDRRTRGRSVSLGGLPPRPAESMAPEAATVRDRPGTDGTTPTASMSVAKPAGASTSGPVVWRPPGPRTSSRSTPWAFLTLIVLGLTAAIVVGLVVFLSGERPVVDRGTATVEVTKMTSPSVTTRRTTEPEPPALVRLPSGYRAATSAPLIAVGSHQYPERIQHAEPFGASLTLRLLTLPSGPPFYLAESKVTNRLVQQYHAENSGRATAWRNEGDNLPAMNLTWLEADAIARWLKGRLPSSEEWDLAAGVDDPQGRIGPFRSSGQGLGVGVSRPLPVDRDHDDVSPRGIRDLSGNGREWTRDKVALGGEDFAILRGRMYTMSTPLTYNELKRYRDPQNSPMQRVHVPSPYTGFRIVIPLE